MHNNINYRSSRFQLTKLAAALFGLSACNVQAAQTFDPAFLENLGAGSAVADLSRFSTGNEEQLPGKYRVDVFVNDRLLDTRELLFAESKSVNDVQVLEPCISYTLLEEMGVRVGAFPELNPYKNDNNNAQSSTCVPYKQFIPDSDAKFDFYQQRLDMSFPQAAMVRTPRGWLPPERWDDGINALMANYSFSGSNTEMKGNDNGRYDNYYLNLRSGINIGPWRLRSYATGSSDNGTSRWQHINTYLQRPLRDLQSTLTLGDSYTPSDIFDSVQFRGAQIASDDEMLPDSLKGFAPVLRGVARTRAQVTVRQNGYVIYQSYVAPGPFVIDDLYPSSSNGDLEVLVKESDGSEQRFTQPFSSLPVMQREGRLKYALTAGQLRRQGYQGKEPMFMQGTMMWGLSRGVTLYGGLVAADGYSAISAGLGKNLGTLGAVSADISQSFSHIGKDHKEHEEGQSLRFLYAKSFAESGTDFRLLGYRYSTKGYHSFQEAADLQQEFSSPYLLKQRSQIQGTLSQSLGGHGSLYASLIHRDYWGKWGSQLLSQVGYNNSWNGISYGLAYSHSRSPYSGQNDQIFSLSVSVPLERFLPSSWASYNMTTERHGATSHLIGVHGTALKDRNLSYSVQQNIRNNGGDDTGSIDLRHQGIYANSNLGYSYSRNSKTLNYGLQGGILAHAGGVTLSQPQGDTMVLVEAKGAAHTPVINNTGVSTDFRGYAVVPYVQPYRGTRVELDAKGLGENVDLLDGAVNVVPTRGAVVKAQFETRVGYRVLMNLTQRDGKPVPFGAVVTLLNDRKNYKGDGFIVGDDGQVYMNGLESKGRIKAKWGDGNDFECEADYVLTIPEDKENHHYLPPIETNTICL